MDQALLDADPARRLCGSCEVLYSHIMTHGTGIPAFFTVLIPDRPFRVSRYSVRLYRIPRITTLTIQSRISMKRDLVSFALWTAEELQTVLRISRELATDTGRDAPAARAQDGCDDL